MDFNDHLPWILLLGGILPLLLGPLLAQLADRFEAARSAVDAFTAVSLGGIVLLHIWPHAFLTAGAWTLVGGLLGLLLPFLLHGSLHAHEEKIYPGFVVLAFLGLAVHATLDGVALFSPLAEAAESAHEAPHDTGTGSHAAVDPHHAADVHVEPHADIEQDQGGSAHRDDAAEPAGHASHVDHADHGGHADHVGHTDHDEATGHADHGDPSPPVDVTSSDDREDPAEPAPPAIEEHSKDPGHQHEAGGIAGHHDHGSGWLLALAVILHRLPMGLAVWWFAVPILGRRFAMALLAAIAVATVVGFSVAGRVLVDFSMPGIAIFEATIAGMLLHVVMGHDHGHAEHADHHVVPWASALGTLGGVALVAALAQVHPMEQRLADALTFSETFRCLAIRLAPWLVGAWWLDLVTRWLARAAPTRWARWTPSRRILGELGWPALAVSWALLGTEWTAWRLAVLLLGLAALVGLDRPSWIDATQHTEGSRRTPGIIEGWLATGHSLVAWGLLTIGWVSLLEPMIRVSLESLASPLAYSVAALAGVLLYRNGLHGSIAALLLFHMGWTPGQLMTFLLVGSAWTLFQGSGARRVAWRGTLGLGLAAAFGLLGFLALGRGASVAAEVTSLHRLLEVEPSAFALGSLGLLVALGLYHLVRFGFRGFLGPIFHAAAPFEVDPDHGHGHSHHGHSHHGSNSHHPSH